VSGAAVSTAIQTVTGLSRQQVREAYRKVGDLGDVAANNFVTRPLQHHFVKTPKVTPSRTIQQVHDMLHSIATVPQGKGSQVTTESDLEVVARL
jgi:ATP-dependent DNA ligase